MRKPFSIRLSWVVAALFALSPLQALAANLTYSRYYYQPPGANATRIPRSTNDGGWRPLDQQSGPGLSNNQTTKIPNDATYATSTTTINNAPYVLVSATVTGGQQGAATVYSPLPAFIPVTVGTADITVAYYYIPVPVPGPPCTAPPCAGGSQVVIDEISDDTGALLDDDFVQVFIPPGAGFASDTPTKNANNLGTVDTGQDTQIRADDQPVDPSTQKTRTSLIFDRWVGSTLSSTGAPVTVIQGNGQRNLDVDKGQTGYFLAHYRNFCPTGFHFVASANASECVPDNCTASQNWDPATNTCVTCSPNTLWDPTKNQCEEISSSYKCPDLCPNRCLVIPEKALFGQLNPPPDCPSEVFLVCRNTEGYPLGPAVCAPAK